MRHYWTDEGFHLVLFKSAASDAGHAKAFDEYASGYVARPVWLVTAVVEDLTSANQPLFATLSVLVSLYLGMCMGS